MHLVQESQSLLQIEKIEKFGESSKISNAKKKKSGESSAAIGYVYKDSMETTENASGRQAGESRSGASFREDSDDEAGESDFEDIDLDVEIDLNAQSQERLVQLDKIAQEYGMVTGDFAKLLDADKKHEEEMQNLKQIEDQKAQFHGRKSRRERKMFKEHRLREKYLKQDPKAMTFGARNLQEEIYPNMQLLMTREQRRAFASRRSDQSNSSSNVNEFNRSDQLENRAAFTSKSSGQLGGLSDPSHCVLTIGGDSSSENSGDERHPANKNTRARSLSSEKKHAITPYRNVSRGNERKNSNHNNSRKRSSCSTSFSSVASSSTRNDTYSKTRQHRSGSPANHSNQRRGRNRDCDREKDRNCIRNDSRRDYSSHNRKSSPSSNRRRSSSRRSSSSSSRESSRNQRKSCKEIDRRRRRRNSSGSSRKSDDKKSHSYKSHRKRSSTSTASSKSPSKSSTSASLSSSSSSRMSRSRSSSRNTAANTFNNNNIKLGDHNDDASKESLNRVQLSTATSNQSLPQTTDNMRSSSLSSSSDIIAPEEQKKVVKSVNVGGVLVKQSNKPSSVSIRELLNRKMIAQLNKAHSANKRIEQAKLEKQEKERMEREKELYKRSKELRQIERDRRRKETQSIGDDQSSELSSRKGEHEDSEKHANRERMRESTAQSRHRHRKRSRSSHSHTSESRSKRHRKSHSPSSKSKKTKRK